MDDNGMADLGSWGKSLLEEILFRAGREMTDPDATPDTTSVSLTFTIAADAGQPGLDVSYERADHKVSRLRVDLG